MLEKIIRHPLPSDPVLALNDADGHVKPEQFDALRESVPRPSAAAYFAMAGRNLGVTVVVAADVVGSDALMPYRETWNPEGKSLGPGPN